MGEDRRIRAVVWLVVVGTGTPVVARLLSAVGVPDLWPMVPLLGAFPLAVVALVVVAAALAAVRRRRPGVVPGRAVVAAAVLALVGGAVLAPRTVGRPQPDAAGPEVVVATVNARRGLADPAAIVALVDRFDVDVLAVVELSPDLDAGLVAAGLSERLPEGLVAAQLGTGGGAVYARWPLAALVEPALDPDTPDVVTTVDGVELAVVSTHPTAPVGPNRTARWRRGLGRIGTPTSRRAVVLVGDFNATLDHATLRDVLGRGWRDAARETGVAWRPTYDGLANGSPGLPMALDHVLVGPGIAVLETSVVDVPGTDHRFVASRLRLP